MHRDGPQRIDCLDALRGLAALSVVLLHVLSIYATLAIPVGSGAIAAAIVFALTRTPLAALYAGTEAVLLFFVLSGFVLALPFFKGRAPDYRTFVVRRVCRIYLPYAAALVAAIAARSLVHVTPVAGVTPWLGRLWMAPPTWETAAGYLAMTGFYADRRIDFVVWSLIHEMRISLIFPLLILSTRRGHPALRLLLAGALSGACAAASVAVSGATAADLAARSFLETGRYLWLFVLGIELARNRRALSERAAAWPAMTAALVCALALCLYSVRAVLPQIDQLRAWYVRDYLIGCGAAGFIVLALGRARWARGLEWPPLLALGRVSYSLYLFHPIVLLTMLYALHDRLPPMVWLPAVLPAAIATAWAAWRFVEQPAIALGRRLTAAPRDALRRPQPRPAPAAPLRGRASE